MLNRFIRWPIGERYLIVDTETNKHAKHSEGHEVLFHTTSVVDWLLRHLNEGKSYRGLEF